MCGPKMRLRKALAALASGEPPPSQDFPTPANHRGAQTRKRIAAQRIREQKRERYRRQRGLPVEAPESPELNVVVSQPISAHDGSVVAAVRAELNAAPAAAERPGLTAVARALAAILDDSNHVAVQPAAARQLVAILGTLSKRTQRRGKLAVVKSMTTTSPSA